MDDILYCFLRNVHGNIILIGIFEFLGDFARLVDFSIKITHLHNFQILCSNQMKACPSVRPEHPRRKPRRLLLEPIGQSGPEEVLEMFHFI